MRWTDRLRLTLFFRRRLAPAALRLRARGVRFFPDGPDDADSWYVPPADGPPLFTREPGEVIPALERLWAAQGLPELAALAEPLAALARRLAPREPGADDPPPFLYTLD